MGDLEEISAAVARTRRRLLAVTAGRQLLDAVLAIAAAAVLVVLLTRVGPLRLGWLALVFSAIVAVWHAREFARRRPSSMLAARACDRAADPSNDVIATAWELADRPPGRPAGAALSAQALFTIERAASILAGAQSAATVPLRPGTKARWRLGIATLLVGTALLLGLAVPPYRSPTQQREAAMRAYLQQVESSARGVAAENGKGLARAVATAAASRDTGSEAEAVRAVGDTMAAARERERSAERLRDEVAKLAAAGTAAASESGAGTGEPGDTGSRSQASLGSAGASALRELELELERLGPLLQATGGDLLEELAAAQRALERLGPDGSESAGALAAALATVAELASGLEAAAASLPVAALRTQEEAARRQLATATSLPGAEVANRGIAAAGASPATGAPSAAGTPSASGLRSADPNALASTLAQMRRAPPPASRIALVDRYFDALEHYAAGH